MTSHRRVDEPAGVPSGLGTVADASLRLHDPGLTPDGLTAELEAAVSELGLAEDVAFVPAATALAVEVPTGRIEFEVRLPDGGLEGMLRCIPREPAALAHIALLADHAGLALSVLGRLNEAERREASARRVAEHLQGTLLPAVPNVPQSTIAVAYRAAARDAKVGGDFYDVFPLPDGRVLLTVGDVVGKGVEAAVHTSRITQTLRALALTHMALDSLLDCLDEQISWQETDLMATLWCGYYTPRSGELEFASLGHPPALLLRGDGNPIRLELEGLPLGLRDLAERPPEIRNRRLASRDLLVLYTDGVVEASKDYLAGQEALLHAIASRREEPVNEILNGALSELLADAGHSDDAAMLVLRRS